MLLQTVRAAAQKPMRVAHTRRYLMCPPTHFGVKYSINPWMEPARPVNVGRAVRQWRRLRNTLLDIGHLVELIEPLPGSPDMVFAANGATVVAGRVLSARFRHPERAAEGPAYGEWFRIRGYDLHEATYVNEGEGDYLAVGDLLLAGTGYRTDPRSHEEVRQLFGRSVVGLTLVDPRFYHLDTALAVLDDEQIMYYPAAFSSGSQATLRELFPDAVVATEIDALTFGLNAALRHHRWAAGSDPCRALSLPVRATGQE